MAYIYIFNYNQEYISKKMDTRLLKILEEETAKEKAKKKKKPIFRLRKEKSVMYYSGWHRGNPVEKEKTEKQAKLV